MTKSGLDILSVGHGHIEISFDNKDEIEAVRADRIVTDMLRRGYALFVEAKDKKLVRVQEFDEKTGRYIIADRGDVEIENAIKEPKLRGRPRKSVAMDKVKAVAIGRSAGG